MEITSTRIGLDQDTVGVIVIVFFFVYGTILGIGVPSCTIVIVSLIRGRRTLWKWPFYHIVYHLIFSDALFFATQILYLFPMMLSGGRQEGASGMFVVAIKIITQKAILYLTLLMAFNRLSVFCAPSLSPVFTEKNMKWSLLITWSLIFFMSTSALLLSPTQKFNKETLKYEDDGDAVIDDHVLYQITENLDYCIPFVIIIFYIFIYFAIRKQRNLARSSIELRSKINEDSKLLVQAFIVTIMLEICYLMKLSGEANLDESMGWFLYITSMLSLTASVANHSIHSIIFLISNSTIRNQLPNLHCKPFCHRHFRASTCRTMKVSSVNVHTFTDHDFTKY